MRGTAGVACVPGMAGVLGVPGVADVPGVAGVLGVPGVAGAPGVAGVPGLASLWVVVWGGGFCWSLRGVAGSVEALIYRASYAGRRQHVLGPFHDPDFQASPEITALRVAGGDRIVAKDWAAFAELREQLRADADQWPDLWGPWSAVAARRLGDPAARELLDEVVAAGFCQPEFLDGELESAFGGDSDWEELSARMATNVVTPPIVLEDWPTLTPGLPLELFRLPKEREPALRELIPGPTGTSWETATSLLQWVSNRWRHANAHMEVDDAVTCLERVEAGQRFACVEYGLVLSQALNAVGIPSRRLSLRQRQKHVGLGRGHVVSEAWIDDWNRWVVLDGQNGWYWTGTDGIPLGTLELQELQHAGAPTPRATVVTGKEFSPGEVDFWFTYFANAYTTGGSWGGPGYTPIFQRNWVNPTRRLERDGRRLYPDLSEVGIGVATDAGQVAFELVTAHPFADGFEVRSGSRVERVPLGAPRWLLAEAVGEHVVELSVHTRYGVLAAKILRYRVA